MPLRSTLSEFTRYHYWSGPLRWLFVSHFLQRLAESVLLIVEPIFLWQLGVFLGEQWPQLETQIWSPYLNPNLSLAAGSWLAWTTWPSSPLQQGLLFVLIVQIAKRVLITVALPTTARLSRTLGLRGSLMSGLCLLAAAAALWGWVAMIMNQDFAGFRLSASMAAASLALGAQALGHTLYFPAYYTLFKVEGQPPTPRAEITGGEFVSRLALVFTPLISTIVALRLGYAHTFFFSSFFLLAAASLLWPIPNLIPKVQWSWANYRRWLADRQQRQFALSEGSLHWETAGWLIFWPIFLFATFQSIVTVGYILSGATFLSLLFAYLSGWMFDHRRRAPLWRRASGWLLGGLWLARAAAAHSPLALVLTDATDRLAASVHHTIFWASALGLARGRELYVFFLHREATISLALILFYAVLGVFVFLGWSWPALVMACMAGAMLSTHWQPREDKHQQPWSLQRPA